MDKEKKNGRYQRLHAQLAALLSKTNDPLARMATIAALLFNKFDYFFWCGFYRLVQGELIVGPYQGPLACQVLAKDQGACWAGIKQDRIIIIPDVRQFPGHIACDSRSLSEIVVPFRDGGGNVAGVLDVDSDRLAQFDEVDARQLAMIVALLQANAAAVAL
ncbi:MAG: GAF domain-containing protein [Chrysiogenales bacterium]